jgi:hypothetical protein
MAQRKDEKFILTEDFLGTRYVVKLQEGLRVYRTNGNESIANPVNAWLRIGGVLFFVMGIMGFILERRLYQTSKL